METSKELYEQAQKLREEASSKNDSVLLYLLYALGTCIVGTFSGLLLLIGWYVENSMPAHRANDLNVVVPHGALWAALGLVIGTLAGAILGMYIVRKRLKEARAVTESAEALEQDETETMRTKAANERVRAVSEQEEARRVEAAAASDAREAQARAEQAARVAKAVDDTRNERREARQNPGYKKPELGNKAKGAQG